MAQQIQLRRGTAAQWTSSNPTLSPGEMGVETDTAKMKIGTGAATWTALPYSGGTAGTSGNSRVSKLKRLANSSALIGNPRTRTAMATPPTVTATAPGAGPVGLSHEYLLVKNGAINTPVPFTYTGGDAYVNPGSGLLTFPVVHLGTTGGNLDNTGKIAISWRIKFMTDADVITFVLLGYSTLYRFLVDNNDGTGLRYVNLTGTATPANGGQQTINLDFGARAPQGRLIVVEGTTSAGIASMYVKPVCSIWKYTPPDNVRAYVVGDSIGASTGASQGANGWVPVMGDLLGWNDIRAACLGGTGYISDTNGTSLKYIDHISDWTSAPDQTDVVIFSGGNNDVNIAPQATIQAAVYNVLAASRTALPSVPFFVLGPDTGITSDATRNSQVYAVENAIGAAVAQMNDPLIKFIPLTQLPEGGSELFGNGTYDNRTGDGNVDFYAGVTGDSAHPKDEGHLYRAQFRAARIRAALDTLS